MSQTLESLTGFQRDLLYVIAGLDRPAGRVVKLELEERIGPITHGRLYPNLDALVEVGFVEKGQQDRRTNYYRLTELGRDAIADRERWEAKYIDHYDPEDDTIRVDQTGRSSEESKA